MYIKKDLEIKYKKRLYKIFEDLLLDSKFSNNYNYLLTYYLKLKNFFYLNYKVKNILEFFFVAFSILFDLFKVNFFIKYKILIKIFKLIIFFNYNSVIDFFLISILPIAPYMREYNIKGLYENNFTPKRVISKIYKNFLNIQQNKSIVYISEFQSLFKSFYRFIKQSKLRKNKIKNYYNEDLLFFFYFSTFLDSFIKKDFRESNFEITDFTKDYIHCDKSLLDLKNEFMIQNTFLISTINQFLNNNIFKNNNCDLFNFKSFNLPKYFSKFEIINNINKNYKYQILNYCLINYNFDINYYKKKIYNNNFNYNIYLKRFQSLNFDFIFFLNDYFLKIFNVFEEDLDKNYNFYNLSIRKHVLFSDIILLDSDDITENDFKDLDIINLSNFYAEFDDKYINDNIFDNMSENEILKDFSNVNNILEEKKSFKLINEDNFDIKFFEIYGNKDLNILNFF
jgi:hypothetical protein